MGLLLDTCGRRPSELALDDLQGRRRTWGELDERSVRVARLLRDEMGLAAGDHAALVMGNRAEVAEIVLGAMLAGVWLTPVNHHLTADEMAYVLADSGARVLFTDPEHESAARSAAAASTESSSAAASTTRVLVAGADLETALAAASTEPLSVAGEPGATMIYTSGTTGRPKGVKRARPGSVAEAFASATSAGVALGLDGSGPHLVTGPMYHAAPLLFAVYDLIAGAPMIVMPRWDAERTLDLIAEHRIRHTHLVPTMFVRLLRLGDEARRRFDSSSLQTVLHGAAPIARHTKQAMIEWWGPVLVEYWGATESGVATLVSSEEWLARPGTVGRPTPSFEVFAADESGSPLPPGEVGTLRLRNKKIARIFEYHRAPEKTAEAYGTAPIADATAAPAPDTGFTIGDIGYVDADGYVYLSDRKSHTIISGGVNIFPAEIEDVLHRHPAIADVAVFGIPDDEWGETVKAAVELVEGARASTALEADILAFAREHLAPFKVPRSVDFEERLPRHPTGKLYVRQLRDRYWKAAGRNI